MGRPRPRNEVIDAFRGVAIVMVMAFHYTVRWAPPLSAVDLYSYHVTFSPSLRLGRLGVEVFFVISGLVITMTMRRAGGAMDFALRRTARILPAFAAAALLGYLLSRFEPAPFHRGVQDLLASFTFMPEHFGGRYIDGVYWSLSVELRFYAWVALAALLLKENFWLGLLAPAAMSLPLHEGIAGWPFIAPFWPYFLIGVAGWYGLFERQLKPAVVVGAAGCALLFVQSEGAAETAFVAGCAALMFALIAARVRVPFLPWIGRISYSLYLLHQNVGVTVIHQLTRLGAPDFVAIGVAVATSVLLAWALFHLVEGPGNRLVMSVVHDVRDRIAPCAPAPVRRREAGSATLHDLARVREAGVESSPRSAEALHGAASAEPAA